MCTYKRKEVFTSNEDYEKEKRRGGISACEKSKKDSDLFINVSAIVYCITFSEIKCFLRNFL